MSASHDVPPSNPAEDEGRPSDAAVGDAAPDVVSDTLEPARGFAREIVEAERKAGRPVPGNDPPSPPVVNLAGEVFDEESFEQPATPIPPEEAETTDPQADEVNWEERTVDELREVARERDITGRWEMTKDELVRALSQ